MLSDNTFAVEGVIHLVRLLCLATISVAFEGTEFVGLLGTYTLPLPTVLT